MSTIKMMKIKDINVPEKMLRTKVNFEDKNVQAIKESMETVGFLPEKAISIDKEGNLQDGFHRLTIALLVFGKNYEVPVIIVNDGVKTLTRQIVSNRYVPTKKSDIVKAITGFIAEGKSVPEICSLLGVSSKSAVFDLINLNALKEDIKLVDSGELSLANAMELSKERKYCESDTEYNELKKAAIGSTVTDFAHQVQLRKDERRISPIERATTVLMTEFSVFNCEKLDHDLLEERKNAIFNTVRSGDIDVSKEIADMTEEQVFAAQYLLLETVYQVNEDSDNVKKARAEHEAKREKAQAKIEKENSKEV